MGRSKLLVSCILLLSLQGCVSSAVQRGAAIGALSGMAGGAALGYSFTDENLLGSPEHASKAEGGDKALDSSDGILAGAIIGAIFGGIVGAMIGHKSERPNDVYLEAAEAAEAEAEEYDEDSEEFGLNDDELGFEHVGPRRSSL